MAPHNPITRDARTDRVTSFQKWFRLIETRHLERCRSVPPPKQRPTFTQIYICDVCFWQQNIVLAVVSQCQAGPKTGLGEHSADRKLPDLLIFSTEEKCSSPEEKLRFKG